MTSVTAFVGSSRKNGVTHRATRQFLDDLQSFGDVRSEVVFLSEYDVRLCRGCKACFVRGEEFCPLHDDRDLLIDKMTRSDGVVLASPVYSFQVSAVMKAFLDRLGFAFHRPRFHGKAYTSIVVEGLYGGRDVVKYLDFVGGALGFNVVKGSRIVCRKNPDTALEPMLEEERRKMDEAIPRAALEPGLPRAVDLPAHGLQDGPHEHQAGARRRQARPRLLPRARLVRLRLLLPDEAGPAEEGRWSRIRPDRGAQLEAEGVPVTQSAFEAACRDCSARIVWAKSAWWGWLVAEDRASRMGAGAPRARAGPS
jgi:multimeric flavodoxin WrbA